MQVDDFIVQVASEPERVVTQTVRKAAPELLARAAGPTGIMLTALRGASGAQAELRYRHILGPPASEQAIQAWQTQHPSCALPPDLRLLLRRMNGIHLWANTETGRSYVGLAPIEEWETADIKFHASPGRASHTEPYAAISYHEDGASFVVLDARSGRYFLMDSAGPDETTPIASDACELLDWLWNTRRFPSSGDPLAAPKEEKFSR